MALFLPENPWQKDRKTCWAVTGLNVLALPADKIGLHSAKVWNRLVEESGTSCCYTCPTFFTQQHNSVNY